MSLGKRMLRCGMLLVPCLFLAGALWVQGRVLSASGTAAVPASADNWGLSFPVEGETPVGNATAEQLAQYNAYYVGDTSQKVLYLTFDCGYEVFSWRDFCGSNSVPRTYAGNFLYADRGGSSASDRRCLPFDQLSFL